MYGYTQCYYPTASACPTYGYGGYGGCGGFGHGFAIIVVLFILLIIIGASCIC